MSPKARDLIWLILAFTMIHVWLNPWLFDPYSQNDDGHFYLAGYLSDHGHTQFGEDPLMAVSRGAGSLGYQALVRLLGSFLDILWIPKLIQILCFMLFIGYACAVGHHLKGRPGALLTGILGMTSMWLNYRLSGGLARGFGPASFMALLYQFLRMDPRGILGVGLWSAVFYPLGMLVGVLGAFLVQPGPAILKSPRFLMIACMNIATWSVIPQAGGVPMIDQVADDPVFQSRGRANEIVPLTEAVQVLARGIGLLYSDNQRGFNEFVDGRTQVTGTRMTVLRAWNEIVRWDWKRGQPFAILLYLFLPIFLARYSFFTVPPGIRFYFLASVAVFTLATIGAFALYQPTQYSLYSMSVLMTLFLPIGILSSSGYRERPVAGNGVLAAILLFFFAVTGPGVTVNAGATLNIWPEQICALEFIRNSTEPEAIIAGPIRDPLINMLPLYAKRRVHASWELSAPWRLRIFREVVAPRLASLYAAYFSSKTDPIELKADYLVIRPGDFVDVTAPDGWIFEPYTTPMDRLYLKNRGSFRFAPPPDSAVVYRDDRYVIVDLKRLRQ